MRARRTSAVLLVVCACLLGAVASAADVQPLDVEWKVGAVESNNFMRTILDGNIINVYPDVEYITVIMLKSIAVRCCSVLQIALIIYREGSLVMSSDLLAILNQPQQHQHQ